MANATAVEDVMRICAAQLPGIDKELLKAELRAALDQFFIESASWRENITVNLYASTSEYDLDPLDADTQIASVHTVYNSSGLPLDPVNNIVPSDSTASSSVRQYRLKEPNLLEVYDTPTEAATLTAVVSKKLRQGVLKFPVYLVSHHKEAIIAGVLSRCFLHKAKPYSDPNLATFHRVKFGAEIKRAKDMAERGYTTGRANWRFPGTFASGTGNARR